MMTGSKGLTTLQYKSPETMSGGFVIAYIRGNVKSRLKKSVIYKFDDKNHSDKADKSGQNQNILKIRPQDKNKMNPVPE